MKKFRYLVKLAFDGSPFHGWQVQKNAVSVQEVITKALEVRLRIEKISLVGCGRTDTGVHAREFYAHFDLDEQMPSGKPDELTYRLNKQLPNQIVIFSIKEVPPGFHARFSAVSRTYRYYLHNRKDPFLDNYSWCLLNDLDIDEMNISASMLLEYDDFTSFARLHSQTETNICNIEEAKWEQDGHRFIFSITADRFLRKYGQGYCRDIG
jgi:tRNA pseudouridine38-40 synthase